VREGYILSVELSRVQGGRYGERWGGYMGASRRKGISVEEERS
jgi:hypothetical protein